MDIHFILNGAQTRTHLSIILPSKMPVFYPSVGRRPRILFGAKQIMFESHINNGFLFGRVRIEGGIRLKPRQARNKFDSHWAWFIIAIIFSKEVIPGVSANDSH
jgi:hypothetical protein